MDTNHLHQTSRLPVCIVLIALLITLVGCGGDDDKSSSKKKKKDRGRDVGQVDHDADTEPADDPRRAGWKDYRHPQGAMLKHPADWTTKDGQGGAALVPPGVEPSELQVILLGVSPPPGSDGPASEKSAKLMDNLVKALGAEFQRTAEPTRLDTPLGPGAVYDYRATLRDGRAYVSRVFLTQGQGVALGLTLFGTADKVADYQDIAELIFTTLQMDKPDAGPEGKPDADGADTDDARLIGVFQGEALAGGGNKGTYVNTQLVNVLNADGTFYSGAKSYFHTSERDYKGKLKWSVSDESGNHVIKGRWSAKGGVITVTLQSGVKSHYAYNFEPDGTLALRDAATRKLINIYKRVQ